MKKLHSVAPNAAEAKMIGQEPVWPQNYIPKSPSLELVKAINWHVYVADKKNFRAYLEEWASRQGDSTDLQKIIDKTPDTFIPNTEAIIARLTLRNFPVDGAEEKIRAALLRKIDSETLSAPEKGKDAPSIQERIQKQMVPVMAAIDHTVSDVFSTGKVDLTPIAQATADLKGPQIKLTTQKLSSYLAEWKLAVSGEDADLRAAYSYTKILPKLIKATETILESLDASFTALKSQRVVRKRPKDKRKIAAKLRLMPEDKDLGVKSVSAVDVIGANLIWLYDTKTKRLGFYASQTKNSLFIRGTVIDGYEESGSKILRKPKEQLAEFMKLRKNQTRAFFDGLSTKSTELVGRTNIQTILLRVD